MHALSIHNNKYNTSLTTSKKSTHMMGPEITIAASKAFERGQKKTNYI
jgi:hypothetical protein